MSLNVPTIPRWKNLVQMELNFSYIFRKKTPLVTCSTEPHVGTVSCRLKPFQIISYFPSYTDSYSGMQAGSTVPLSINLIHLHIFQESILTLTTSL